MPIELPPFSLMMVAYDAFLRYAASFFDYYWLFADIDAASFLQRYNTRRYDCVTSLSSFFASDISPSASTYFFILRASASHYFPPPMLLYDALHAFAVFSP
jgi:hypothetical protein